MEERKASTSPLWCTEGPVTNTRLEGLMQEQAISTLLFYSFQKQINTLWEHSPCWPLKCCRCFQPGHLYPRALVSLQKEKWIIYWEMQCNHFGHLPNWEKKTLFNNWRWFIFPDVYIFIHHFTYFLLNHLSYIHTYTLKHNN